MRSSRSPIRRKSWTWDTEDGIQKTGVQKRRSWAHPEYQALPGACVEGYEQHIADVSLPDPADRHVLAAAIEIQADYIVTNNLKDFPSRSLAPYGITACSSDAFIMMLYEQAPEEVIGVVRTLRASLSHPPQTPQQLLAHFRRSGLTRIADALQRHNI